MAYARELYGMQRVRDGLVRKDSEWWGEKVKLLVKEVKHE